MASRRPTHNFVTSPSGLVYPEVTDDAVNDRTDITFDIAPSTADGWVLTTEGGVVGWAPPSGGGGGGVDSIEADGEGQLTGDVTFSEGSGITLTTSGNDIEIASAGGGVTEVANVTFTSNASISATTEAGGDTVVSAGAITYEAVQHKIEFWAPRGRVFGAGGHITMILNLWDASSNLCRFGMVSHVDAGSGEGAPIYCCRYLTPSAASHTYIVKAWVSGASASGQFDAGDGSSSSTLVPGFIRITKGG